MSDTESITIGDVRYVLQDDGDIQIYRRDSQGWEHSVGHIAARDDDWEQLLAGADPILDRWEDGNGYSIGTIVDIERVAADIQRVVESLTGERIWWPTIYDDILNSNDYVSLGYEWNGAMTSSEIEEYADGYVAANYGGRYRSQTYSVLNLRLRTAHKKGGKKMTENVLTESRACEIITDIMTEAGDWEHVDIDILPTDRHSIRWERTRGWIKFSVPRHLLMLDEDVFSSIFRVTASVIDGRTVDIDFPPATVLQMRERLGYIMPMYDADGIRIPEAA